MTAPTYDSFFHGCRLRSAIPLASLPAWPVLSSEAAPEITLTLGQSPDNLTDLLWSSPFIQIARDKSALVKVAVVARFFLPNGSDIIVDPAPGVAPCEIEAIFLSTVAGLILHQRHLLPLHASCVLYQGRAIAINGLAAHGKSALAAALVKRGATLLADDLCVVRTSNNAVHAVGGCNHARLWPDVMDHLEIPSHERLITRRNHPKHAVEMPAAQPGEYPLTHLVRISMFTTSSSGEIVLLHGPASVLPGTDLIFQRDLGHLLGNASLEFRVLTALVRTVHVYSMHRSLRPEDLEQLVNLILAVAEGEA